MAVYRRASRRRYVLLLVVLTSVTLITLDRRHHDSGALGTVGRAAHTLVSPVETGVSDIARPVGNWFDGVFSSGSLEKKNKALESRIADLEGQVRANQAAAIENRQLKEATDLPINDNVPRVVARIVNRSPGNFESTITLDKGTDAGILADMPVIAHEGVVGRVITSWSGGCKVLLLTDPDFSVAVEVEGQRPATGVASGRSGSSTMSLPLDTSATRVHVKAGDLVVTNGFSGSNFPAGLQVGKVSDVKPQLGGVAPILRVRPFVDFAQLDFVAVMKWSPGQGSVTTTTTTTTTTAPVTTTVPGQTTTIPGPTTTVPNGVLSGTTSTSGP